jgi:hypothetical protein
VIITNLNNTHNVFKRRHAIWQATFNTSEGYMEAIVKMYQSFGPGQAYLNCPASDQGQPWFFRNRDPNILHKQNHCNRIYLTDEKQITFLMLSFDDSD